MGSTTRRTSCRLSIRVHKVRDIHILYALFLHTFISLSKNRRHFSLVYVTTLLTIIHFEVCQYLGSPFLFDFVFQYWLPTPIQYAHSCVADVRYIQHTSERYWYRRLWYELQLPQAGLYIQLFVFYMPETLLKAVAQRWQHYKGVAHRDITLVEEVQEAPSLLGTGNIG